MYYYIVLVVYILTFSSNTCFSIADRIRHNRNTYESSAEEQKLNPNLVHFNSPKLFNSDIEKLLDYDSYIYDQTQENINPKSFGGINIQKEAKSFGYILRDFSNKEIGVTEMQAIYDALPFDEVQLNISGSLSQLVNQLSDKLDKYLMVLGTTRMTVENLYGLHLTNPITLQRDCCNIPVTSLRWDDQYVCNVDRGSTCDLVAASTPTHAFNPGRNLTELFQHNVHIIPSIKWQYFISEDGVYNAYPAHNYLHRSSSGCHNVQDEQHRYVHMSAILPQRKHIVIMVDQGNSLSDNQLLIAKAVATHILSTLGENDRVGLIGLSSDVLYPRNDGCVSRTLGALTYEARLYFTAFIDKLEKTAVPTNHSLGFQKAFAMIQEALSQDSSATSSAMVVYISRGLLSSLRDAKEVLETIATENTRQHNRVVINTYTVIDDEKPILYEKTFLRDVAHQNCTKYLGRDRCLSAPRGRMVAVNTTVDLTNLIGNFAESFNWNTSTRPHVSMPTKDDVSQGIIFPLAWPCYYDKKLLGIVGMDVHFGDVVEGVTYFAKDKNSYAFLLDRNGFTLMHPDMRRPMLTNVQPMHTHIRHFEKHEGFEAIVADILRQPEGRAQLELPREVGNNSFSLFMPIVDKVKITYVWKEVFLQKMGAAPFIAVVKQVDDGFRLRDLDPNYVLDGNQLVYHRLDVLPTDHTCMHLKQLATLDTSSLFLSAAAFTRPFEHLSEVETKRMVQGYLAYLNDNTNLIRNPGIKDEVRKDVAAISKLNSVWIKTFFSSDNNDYIVRRYVATPSGALRMFPGTLLNKALDPTKREWYQRAMEYPGKITLTSPYLDGGGAGYIVTLSHTIYEGKHAALHGPFDRVVAVMALDVTLKFFYKKLVEQMPVCEAQGFRCFIMDDRGYLIAHEKLIEPTGRGPLEKKHITHQEPLVINNILNHKGFVRKKLCNSYNDGTMQRFYQLNTSLEGVITNLVDGEHCAKYEVTLIPGTNLFMGLVNHEACESMAAFCPCSMVDRLCLNCYRMEQTECECPCECPLHMNFCSGQLLHEEDDNPSCPPFPEDVAAVPVSDEVADVLPQCYTANCDGRTSKQACLGALNCEWCELENDGVTPLRETFCSSQRVCFAGVLGAPTPYQDQISYEESQLQSPGAGKSTPVGPVAGGIMGCFLILALGVYCYRHHIHRRSAHYSSSLPDGQGRGASLDNDIEELDCPDDLGTGNVNVVLATFDNPASVSPYRVNTGYRRPTQPESDLGYSTMTPQDDSEQASTTCIEPLIIGRDRYRPPPRSNSLLKVNPMLPPPPPSTGVPGTGAKRHTMSPTRPSPCQTQLSAIASSDAPERPLLDVADTSALDSQTQLPGDLRKPYQLVTSAQVHMVDTC